MLRYAAALVVSSWRPFFLPPLSGPRVPLYMVGHVSRGSAISEQAVYFLCARLHRVDAS